MRLGARFDLCFFCFKFYLQSVRCYKIVMKYFFAFILGASTTSLLAGCSSLDLAYYPTSPDSRSKVGVCSRAIPALLPLNDQAANMVTSWARAPAIAAGDEIRLSHVSDAEEEARVRSRHFQNFYGSTASEVTEADIRLHAVRHEYSKAVYPYPIKTSSMSEGVCDMFYTLNHKIDAIAGAAATDRRAIAEAAATDRRAAAADRLAAANDRRTIAEAAANDRRAIAQAVGAIAQVIADDRRAAAADRQRTTEILDTVKAQIRNQLIRAQNRQALMDSNTKGPGKARFRPLLKENSGLGGPLPGTNANVQPIAPRVGQPVGAPFPTTVRRLCKLNGDQLSTLSMLFNDDFGITARDNLQKRRTKFQQFIIGL